MTVSVDAGVQTQCSADGNSYSVVACQSSGPSAPSGFSVCSGGTTSPFGEGCSISETHSLNGYEPIPPNWPCTVTPYEDGGPAYASVDGGAGPIDTSGDASFQP